MMSQLNLVRPACILWYLLHNSILPQAPSLEIYRVYV